MIIHPFSKRANICWVTIMSERCMSNASACFCVWHRKCSRFFISQQVSDRFFSHSFFPRMLAEPDPCTLSLTQRPACKFPLGCWQSHLAQASAVGEMTHFHDGYKSSALQDRIQTAAAGWATKGKAEDAGNKVTLQRCFQLHQTTFRRQPSSFFSSF